MNISERQHRRLEDTITLMRESRQAWWPVWQDISDYFLPRRYPWLFLGPPARPGQPSGRAPSVRNTRLLDSTSSRALRVLATGMMNGITSPARPWFKLALKNKKYKDPSHVVNVWLAAATKAMHTCMAGTNFYSSLGIMYLEFSAFGTASLGIYENFEAVFRCKNYPIGGFMISTNSEGKVDTHAREFTMPLDQIVEKWPEAVLPTNLKAKVNSANIQERKHPCIVRHLVEPNRGEERFPKVRRSAKFREVYWLDTPEHLILDARGLDEFPHVTPRWEVYADDVWGTSPCMEAHPDVLQLQHLVKRKAQGLDKMVSPPMLAHSSLASKPKAFLPDGITYVSSADLQQGARPTYQINIPFQELHIDITEVQSRIKEVLFNDLFRMISDLDTVRSASEIDARREEKLVLLGPVLERFESEALRPSIERIFGIMMRADLFPPLPPELEGEELDPEYTGVLSDALRAVGTVSIERWLAFLGGLTQMSPDVIQIPDFDEMVRYYADAIGVPPQLLKERQQASEDRAAENEMGVVERAAGIGQQLASGAEALSKTDVGGGVSALQTMMGG